LYSGVVTEGTFSVEWRGERNLDVLGDDPRGKEYM